MKQLLSRFAPHGKTARPVGARLQASLHVFANAEVLILHPIAHIH